MRDDSYLDSVSEAAAKPAGWRRGATTAVGAAISLVLIGGFVTWSYRLGVRDAREIPVIRAELEPTRIRPAEPGGAMEPHQERRVYEAVSGGGSAPAVETIALAPPPETLAEEDVAPAAASPEPAPRPAAAPESALPPAGESGAGSDIAAAPEAAADAEPETTTGAADPLAAAVEAALAEVLAEPPADGGDDRAAGAPRFAPVAASRPARATADARPLAASPETVAASAVQVQLGAFASEEIAQGQWAAISGQNGDLLSGLGRTITPVQSGGQTLWRLRAGPFATVADAAALCRGLAARRQDCIVARAR